MCELSSNPEKNSSSTHYNSDSCHFHTIIKDRLAQLPPGYKSDIYYGRRNHYSTSVLILKSINPPVNRSAKLLGFLAFFSMNITVLICSFSGYGFFFFLHQSRQPQCNSFDTGAATFPFKRALCLPSVINPSLIPREFCQ